MWLSHLFSTILHMSLTASIVILTVCALRLLLKRAPKVFSYALWLVVLFRLLCPVTFESPTSALPEQLSIDISQMEVDLSSRITPEPAATETPRQAKAPQTASTPSRTPSLTTIAGIVWLTSVGGMILYSLLSLTRLRRRLVGTVRLRDNLYLVDHLSTPFVLGVFRPKIYLPSALSEQEQEYILLHEQAHIRRGDHIAKLLGFFALSLHWFNPLVWLAFRLAVNDMELSCDEVVLSQLKQDLRPEYAATLLRLATGRPVSPGIPLAFESGNIKERIRNVLNHKKPTVVALAVALVVCITATVCLATNPSNDRSTVLSATLAQPVDDTLDSAISNAILGEEENRYLSCECAGEGHFVMDYTVENNTLTAYVLTTYGEYQFVDDLFIEASGCGVIPAVITFQINQDGSYTLLNYQVPEDGGMYETSIKELFPSHLREKCLSASNDDTLSASLRTQQDKYAEAYLSSIGRDAKIGDYADLNQPLLTDLGVSVEVSNKLTENDLLSNYPLGIGKQEQVEDGVRYVYRQEYDEQKQVISFTKSNYETGKIVERFCFDATDGTLIQALSFPKTETK